MSKIESIQFNHTKESYEQFLKGNYDTKGLIVITYKKPTVINGYMSKDFKMVKTWNEYLKLLDRLSKV